MCDRCGFRFRLTELRTLTVKAKRVPLKVCRSCWEPDHPQLHIGMYPVSDPQALREPRPDPGMADSRTLTHQILIGAGLGSTFGIVFVGVPLPYLIRTEDDFLVLTEDGYAIYSEFVPGPVYSMDLEDGSQFATESGGVVVNESTGNV